MDHHTKLLPVTEGNTNKYKSHTQVSKHSGLILQRAGGGSRLQAHTLESLPAKQPWLKDQRATLM